MTRLILSILPLAAFALLALALFVALRHGHPEQNKFAQHVGDPAPVTSLRLLGASGTVFNTADWKGRAYAVNFFASWCVYCQAEHAGLLLIAKAQVPLIGIAYKDHDQPLTDYLQKKGNPYLAVALDPLGKAFIDWGLTGVPETFIIDSKGVIRYHYAGPMSESVIMRDFMPAWKAAQDEK